MFRGVNTLSLDDKGRLAVPARYRERLRSGGDGTLIITVDRDRCLLLYPLSDWEALEQRLAALPNLNGRTRRLQRLLIGHATECGMDGHGRILVPPPLREFAGLDKRVVLIGQGSKFELWDEPTWTERRSQWLAGEDDEPLSAELESLSL